VERNACPLTGTARPGLAQAAPSAREFRPPVATAEPAPPANPAGDAIHQPADGKGRSAETRPGTLREAMAHGPKRPNPRRGR